MTFEMVRLPDRGETIVYKCFFGEEGKEYGEFFFEFDVFSGSKGRGRMSMKEPTYAGVLVRAFAKAMLGEFGE